MFREPSRTVNSMIAVARQQQVDLSFSGGLEIWSAAYLQVLRRHRQHGEWVFVHYDQVLDRSGIPRLERAVGTTLDASIVDSALRRSPPTGTWPTEVDDIYRELCELAEFAPA